MRLRTNNIAESDELIHVREQLTGMCFEMYFAGICCGGKYQEKYSLKNTVWEIWILPKRGTFFIRHGGKSLFGAVFKKFDESISKYITEIQAEAETGG